MSALIEPALADQAPAPGNSIRSDSRPSRPTVLATRSISLPTLSIRSTHSLNALAILPAIPARRAGMRTWKLPRPRARSASSTSCRIGSSIVPCPFGDGGAAVTFAATLRARLFVGASIGPVARPARSTSRLLGSLILTLSTQYEDGDVVAARPPLGLERGFLDAFGQSACPILPSIPSPPKRLEERALVCPGPTRSEERRVGR